MEKKNKQLIRLEMKSKHYHKLIIKDKENRIIKVIYADKEKEVCVQIKYR